MSPARPLEPAQVQQFREAFQLVDHDKDGLITEPDLHHLFASLGIAPSRHTLNALLAAHPADAGISFTVFLTMMSDHLSQFDPHPDLTDAFECFDESDSGTVKVDEMRRWMADVGERMDQQEIDTFFSGPFTDRHGNFSYRAWLKTLSVHDDANDPDTHT